MERRAQRRSGYDPGRGRRSILVVGFGVDPPIASARASAGRSPALDAHREYCLVLDEIRRIIIPPGADAARPTRPADGAGAVFRQRRPSAAEVVESAIVMDGRANPRSVQPRAGRLAIARAAAGRTPDSRRQDVGAGRGDRRPHLHARPGPTDERGRRGRADAHLARSRQAELLTRQPCRGDRACSTARSDIGRRAPAGRIAAASRRAVDTCSDGCRGGEAGP